MGYKVIKNNQPEKNSFFKEHKETLIIMAVGFLVLIGLAMMLLADKALGKVSQDKELESAIEEVQTVNPYEEGQAEYYAFEGHEAEVTGVMEMDNLDDGTKVWYVCYVDGWTAWVYLSTEGETKIKVDNIP